MPSKNRIKPRKIAKQRRSKATINVLIEATARILGKEGFLRTTTDRIAETAGVSIGSLYQYFPSKEAIVSKIVEYRINQELDLIKTQMEDLKDLPIEESVRAFIRGLLSLYASNPKRDAVLLEQLERVGQAHKMIEADSKVIQWLREYFETKNLRSESRDIELLSYIMVHAVHSVIHASVLSRPELLQDNRFLDELTLLALNYVNPSRGGRLRTK